MNASNDRRVIELAARLGGADMEAARAAQRDLRQLVRHAGRPNAADERKVVVRQLLTLADPAQPAAVVREALWLLGEIGGDESVETLAQLLHHPTAREDARVALDRIGGAKAVAALRSALRSVPDDFRPAIAESLRANGVALGEYPSVKRTPTKATTVRQLDRSSAS